MSAGHILLGAPASTLPPEAQAKARTAADQFEAMALGQLLEPMFDTVDLSKDMFGGGSAEATWRPMMVQEIAKSISAKGGLGIAEPVYQQMLRLQEAQLDRRTR